MNSGTAEETLDKFESPQPQRRIVRFDRQYNE
jgi:hypothetical protein